MNSRDASSSDGEQQQFGNKRVFPTDQKRQFEVGVEGMGGDYEHINVKTRTPYQAFKEAEKKARRKSRYDLREPVNAYQAYEVDAGVTHHP